MPFQPVDGFLPHFWSIRVSHSLIELLPSHQHQHRKRTRKREPTTKKSSDSPPPDKGENPRADKPPPLTQHIKKGRPPGAYTSVGLRSELPACRRYAPPHPTEAATSLSPLISPPQNSSPTQNKPDPSLLVSILRLEIQPTMHASGVAEIIVSKGPSASGSGLCDNLKFKLIFLTLLHIDCTRCLSRWTSMYYKAYPDSIPPISIDFDWRQAR